MYNNPYFNPMQTYLPNQNIYKPLDQSTQPIQTMQPVKTNALLGRMVDSIDVVKAMDISLDGTVNYFPLTDNSTIVTKQLLTDGTSKTTIYKPIAESEVEEVKYATIEDIKKEIEKIDFSDIEDEIEEIRRAIKEIKKKKEE